MENLWSQIKTDSKEPTGPMKALFEQKDFFNKEPLFIGKLTCEIRSSVEICISSSFKLLKGKSRTTDKYFENYLCIKTGPKLNFYIINIIRVASPNISMLPCEISSCVNDQDTFLCETEADFENYLRNILLSDSVRQTLNNLLIMCG